MIIFKKLSMQTSIITGDIINSRKINSERWIPSLKNVLNKFGSEPAEWEIYRGDSFQVEVKPEDALRAAILIKAYIKQNKELDVRMAIGIGKINHKAKKITESNGTAFINSGECYDNLKRKTLAIRSGNEIFDEDINVYIDLSLLTMNNWTENSAKIVSLRIEKPTATQKELSEELQISQSNVSSRITRSGYDEIMNMEKKYRKKIQKI